MSQVSFSFDEDEIRRCIDALYYDVMRLERELEHGADEDAARAAREPVIERVIKWARREFKEQPPGFTELVLRLLDGVPWESPPTYEALRSSVHPLNRDPTARPANVG